MANPVPRAKSPHDQRALLSFDHAAIAATTTIKIGGAPVDRPELLSRCWYNNPTGFAQDPTNFWIITLKSGATTLASWSTLTGAQGTLTADTPVNLLKSATPGGAANDTYSVVFTKTGAPGNLPAGRLMAELFAL